MSLTTSRQSLATALEGTGYAVYDTVRENMSVPFLMLKQDEPYIDIVSIGASPRLVANFRLTFGVALQDNTVALANLESLIEETIQALPQGTLIGSVGRVGSTDVGTTKILTADAPISIRTT